MGGISTLFFVAAAGAESTIGDGRLITSRICKIPRRCLCCRFAQMSPISNKKDSAKCCPRREYAALQNQQGRGKNRDGGEEDDDMAPS